MAHAEHAVRSAPNMQRRRYWGMLALLAVIVMAFSVLVSLSAGIHMERFASFRVVRRTAFVQAYSPIALAQNGLPPNSSVTTVPPASPEIRAIIVKRHKIVLRAAGRTVRVIRTRRRGISLPRLARLVHDSSWIYQSAAHSVTLLAALTTDPGVNMTIGGPRVRVVRLVDIPSVFIGTDHGRLNFTDVTVESIPSISGVDAFYKPFIMATANAVMNITDSTFIGLGWDWNASYGASWEDGSTGRVVGSTFEDGFIGAYTGYARNMLFSHDVFRGNALYGLDPHSYSYSLTITHVLAVGNHAHGIIFSNHVTNSSVLDSVSRDNGENGVMMDLSSTHNVIRGNTVIGNTGDGLVTSTSPHNVFANNFVSGDRIGVRLGAGDARTTTLTDNRVTDNGLADQHATLSGTNTTADNGGQWDIHVLAAIWSVAIGALGLAALVLALAGRRRRNRQLPLLSSVG